MRPTDSFGMCKLVHALHKLWAACSGAERKARPKAHSHKYVNCSSLYDFGLAVCVAHQCKRPTSVEIHLSNHIGCTKKTNKKTNRKNTGKFTQK